MPKIYSEGKRQEITNRLMAAGLELIKKNGMKKTNIESITKKVGIAQGTFYNFFESKEVLIYSIAQAYSERINSKTNAIIKEKGYLERDDLQQLYYSMILKDEDNIYRFLKTDDIKILVTRLPFDYANKMAETKTVITSNLSMVKGKKEICDLDAIINWVQIMNLTIENKDLLTETGIEKIVCQMIENMLNEIFK